MDSEVNLYHKIKIVKYVTTDYSDNYDYVTEIVHKTISESEWYTVTDEEYKDLVITIDYLRNRSTGNEKYLLIKRENIDEFRKDIEFFKEELDKIKKRELAREKKEKETEEKRRQRALSYQKNKEKNKIEKLKKEAKKLGLKVE